MSEALDLHVKFPHSSDAEAFANCIKDAMTEFMRASEHFSAVRLESTPLRMNEFMHPGMLGFADGQRIEVRESGKGALTLAGIVIHELAHTLVGTANAHNENWRDGCTALGLLNHSTQIERYEREHFAPGALTIITSAIERFAKANPTLVYDPNMEIPWPAGVGTYMCEREHESYHPCYNDDGTMHHRAHILEFQIRGIREMLARPGNILLADEMGLGKTVEVMGYINATKPKRIFIGCPNNIKLIWQRHFRDYCTESYDVEVAYTKLYCFSDVVIMNYEALATKWADAVKMQEWDLVVYDEGHYLKTPSAKRSRAAYGVRGKKQIICTGSPIVNYPYEIFPLIHWLDRPRWSEYSRFELQYGSRSTSKLGRNLNRLQAILRETIMTRRQKRDVLSQLPLKRRQVIEFEVSDEVRALIEEEKRLFDTMQRDADTELARFLNIVKNESDHAGSDEEWLELVLSLKQTKRFAFEEMAKIAHRIGLAKLPYIYEHIENMIEAREKVLVFGHHRDVLMEIHKRFSPGSVLLLGGNADQGLATQQAADRFNSDSECHVFCAQVTIAQGYSVQGASTVLFVEEDWVPGVMTQAEDRCHGIGRGSADAKSLLIQHLVFEDSLDTYKAQLTIKKQRSIDRAMNHQPKPKVSDNAK